MQLSKIQITETLSSSLGADKAKASVERACSSLSYSSEILSVQETQRLLTEIAQEGGLVKAASKIAGIRLGLGKF